MNQECLKEILTKHKLWLEDKEGGKRAILSHADLRNADLRSADLRYADLDFSCWPLWCGSNKVKVDRKLALQLIAHICVLDCDDTEVKEVQKNLLPLAKQCHRASELGLLEDTK